MPHVGSFLLYVFIVSFTPGPNNILSMSNASRYGFRKSIYFSFGVCIGFFSLLLFSSYFNLFFIRFMPKIERWMQLFGSAFMLYLAYQIMTSKTKEKNDLSINHESNQLPQKQETQIIDQGIKRNLFLTGISLQFINPKAILFALTVVAKFIIPYYQSNVALISFSLLLAVVSILSTGSWAFFGLLFNRFLSNYQRQFNIVMGLLLVYSAISTF